MTSRRLAAVALVLAAVLGACGGGQKTVALKSKHSQLQPASDTGTDTGATTNTADTSTTGGSTNGSVSGTASTSGTIVARPAPTAPSKPAPATTAAPAPGPTGAPATITVTGADDGKSYALHRGDRLVVQLGPGYSWTEPVSSNEAVLARTTGSTSGDGSAQASFAATTAGAANVTATGTAPPSPCRTANPPCMMPDYARQFRVSVTVS
jgi:hypothetical protein